MNSIVYVNGSYVPADEAHISVFDRGFLFGDGIYEVVPVVNGKLIDREYFLERMGYSLGAIQLAWPCSTEALLQIMSTLVTRNGITEGSIYLQVTRGIAERDFPFPAGVAPTLVVWGTRRPILAHPQAESGVAVITVPELRWQRRDIKSLNLLAQCLAKQAAREAGAFEAWMVEGGLVTEGGSSSAFIVTNGRIVTRPLSNAILPGIRRRVILETVRQNHLDIEERAFTVTEALAADEAFLSSATTLVLPVTSIDGQAIGDGRPGPVTRKVRSLYLELIRQAAGLDGDAP